MEQALAGRGKMGSMVGASDEVKRAAGVDLSLNEYAVCSGLHPHDGPLDSDLS